MDGRLLPIVRASTVGTGPFVATTYVDGGDIVYRRKTPQGSTGTGGPAFTFGSPISLAGRRIGFWVDFRGEGSTNINPYQIGFSVSAWPVRPTPPLSPTWTSLYCEVIVNAPVTGDNGLGAFREGPVAAGSWIEMRRPRLMLLA